MGIGSEENVERDNGTSSPPRRKVSFRDSCMGDKDVTNETSDTQRDLLDDILDDEMEDGNEDDKECPTVKVSNLEKKKLRSQWRNALIIKLLVTLDEYEKVLFDAPWVIADHYLVVSRWYPNFDPTSFAVSKLAVWVRFPGLPMEYYDETFLLRIEVDLEKPLLSKFRLCRRVRRIKYEALHLVCFHCGKYGHRKEECPAMKESAEGTVEELEKGNDEGKISEAINTGNSLTSSRITRKKRHNKVGGKSVVIIEDVTLGNGLDSQDRVIFEASKG
ncbi:hypothetical protein DITRI_Ditri07aG0099700 [Diplodiscus trichospermus]